MRFGAGSLRRPAAGKLAAGTGTWPGQPRPVAAAQSVRLGVAPSWRIGRGHAQLCRRTAGPERGAGRAPAAPCAAPSIPAAVDRIIESTWYFRQESFHWNERSGGADFVNEYGPISTLGYQHRNGIERYRIELFGGTVAYDGAAKI